MHPNVHIINISGKRRQDNITIAEICPDVTLNNVCLHIICLLNSSFLFWQLLGAERYASSRYATYLDTEIAVRYDTGIILAQEINGGFPRLIMEAKGDLGIHCGICFILQNITVALILELIICTRSNKITKFKLNGGPISVKICKRTFEDSINPGSEYLQICLI